MKHLVGFGKHRQHSIEWVFFNDPGWVWWAVHHDAITNLRGGARARFFDLVRRAQHLKVPGHCLHCESAIETMSLTQHPSGGLARVDFFCSRHCHDGGSVSLLTKPSFYTPDFFREYDKFGGRVLVNAIKRAYFGSPPPRMTQAVMEEFFDTAGNFVNF